ncbi:MAG: hypothetical protein M3Y27_01565, partial [Acidobacteriota bacterium]|nr:hypothetical protein [Acidobacteriota bacterium]
IDRSSTLKATLKDALSNFEQALDELAPQEGEEALALYLDKVRRLTFGFHLAVIKRATRGQFGAAVSCDSKRRLLSNHTEEMQRIGKLYRFI